MSVCWAAPHRNTGSRRRRPGNHRRRWPVRHICTKLTCCHAVLPRQTGGPAAPGWARDRRWSSCRARGAMIRAGLPLTCPPRPGADCYNKGFVSAAALTGIEMQKQAWQLMLTRLHIFASRPPICVLAPLARFAHNTMHANKFPPKAGEKSPSPSAGCLAPGMTPYRRMSHMCNAGWSKRGWRQSRRRTTPGRNRQRLATGAACYK